jgi:hypothetical protein
MQKTKRRLTLDKTTIAHLTGRELDRVHGGQKPVTLSACGGECSLACPSGACTSECFTQVACSADRFCV